jgi:hypothetical protein
MTLNPKAAVVVEDEARVRAFRRLDVHALDRDDYANGFTIDTPSRLK